MGLGLWYKLLGSFQPLVRAPTPLPKTHTHTHTQNRLTHSSSPIPTTPLPPPTHQVVNYPFDGYSDPRQRYGPHLSPEDSAFKHLAHVYANKHAYMSKSEVGGVSRGWG